MATLVVVVVVFEAGTAGVVKLRRKGTDVDGRGLVVAGGSRVAGVARGAAWATVALGA